MASVQGPVPPRRRPWCGDLGRHRGHPRDRHLQDCAGASGRPGGGGRIVQGKSSGQQVGLAEGREGPGQHSASPGPCLGHGRQEGAGPGGGEGRAEGGQRGEVEGRGGGGRVEGGGGGDAEDEG